MKNLALPWYLCKNDNKNRITFIESTFLKDYKTFLTDFM